MGITIMRDYHKEYLAAKERYGYKLYQNEYQREWHRDYGRKRVWMMGVLKNALGGCVDCGFNGSPVALEFDHRPEETKSFNVASMHSMAWHRVLTEMAKCDLVCANCHAIRTKGRGVGDYKWQQS